MSVGIVVPAYDFEPEVTYPYLRRLRDAIGPMQLVLEVDGADGAIERPPEGVTVHRHPGRRGKGAAIACGFDHLETDVYSYVDDDACVPPAAVDRLVRRVDAGADLAAGSRRHPAGPPVDHWSPLRRRLGDVFAWVARRVLEPPLFDYQCGAKALTAEAWRGVRDVVTHTGYAWDLDVITSIHANGGAVEEIPVRWSGAAGSRVAILPTAVELAASTLRLRRRSHERDDGSDRFTRDGVADADLPAGPSDTRGRRRSRPDDEGRRQIDCGDHRSLD